MSVVRAQSKREESACGGERGCSIGLQHVEAVVPWDQVVERQHEEATGSPGFSPCLPSRGLVEHPDGLGLAFVGSLASGLRPSPGSV